jgi:ParB-like chromosome segregation protein Spo0J
MVLMNINEIKPDHDQPRRTFNEDKMKALEASMKDNGFRKDYPIILNGGNTIVDGERRWRAAKAVGIKEVPVEVKHDISDWERLLYQLQSEGAELLPEDRLEAWYNLYQKSKQSYSFLAEKLGITEDVFKKSVGDYASYLLSMESLSGGGKISPQEPKRFWPLTVIGKEKDPDTRRELAEKAVKEDWTTDKARDIRQAIAEKPMRKDEILSQDYSDPVPGSQQWRTKLEIAKSDLDLEAQEIREKTTGEQALIADRFNDVISYGLKFKYALEALDYKGLGDKGLVSLHHNLTLILPNSTYPKYEEITKYLKEKGLLTSEERDLLS